jgi:hypothetical protein
VVVSYIEGSGTTCKVGLEGRCTHWALLSSDVKLLHLDGVDPIDLLGSTGARKPNMSLENLSELDMLSALTTTGN